jgi:hypothetical protein
MAFTDQDNYGTHVRPRDYGIVLRTRDNDRLFVSPSKLAIAAIMADSPEETRGRIGILAEQSRKDPRDLERFVREGVRRRTKSTRLLDSAAEDVVDVQHLGGGVVAHVDASKGRVPYRVRLFAKGDTYSYVSCSCPDNQWSDVKGVEYEMCKHASAVHEAMQRDIRERVAEDESRTGLSPARRSRIDLIVEPSFTEASIALLAYAGKESMYNISRQLLSRERPGLEEALRQGRASYSVLRQDRPASGDSRYDAALRNFERNMRKHLKDSNFWFESYGLEFPDSDYESVGIRFRRGDKRVVLCFWPDRPPVIVRKTLREFDGGSSEDQHSKSPYSRLGWYSSVDDSTRRFADTNVIVPGFREDGKKIEIAKHLRDVYRGLIGRA